MKKSYFDGGVLGYWGHILLSCIITSLSFGILFPWAMCFFYEWEIRHTVIGGRRLKFTGTGLKLFANWIKWFFLIIITFGIYGFWVNIKIKQWITYHTVFEDEYSN